LLQNGILNCALG